MWALGENSSEMIGRDNYTVMECVYQLRGLCVALHTADCLGQTMGKLALAEAQIGLHFKCG